MGYVRDYLRRIYDVSKSISIGMGVTLKHMLTPETIITKQYVGLKTPVETSSALGSRVAHAIGVTNDYGVKNGHEGCLICAAAKKLGIGEDPHAPSTDPVEVYDRYYRTDLYISKPQPIDYIPPRHRGLHYLETEKCIMCFQCARACPVDCIDIEGTRDGEIQGAHKGDKVVLTRFTIDYALCIFCDHCTLACPDKQVCIHMGKEFDFTSYDQASLVKNLLTDKPFSKEDRAATLQQRAEIDRLADEKKKAREAAKAAAKKPAAPAAPAAAAPAPAAGVAAPSAQTKAPAAKVSPDNESKAKTDVTNKTVDDQKPGPPSPGEKK